MSLQRSLPRTIEQQLCRWLLLTMDRITSREVHITQELLGEMLGVRRGSITKAAANLRDARLISYERGLLTVSSRDKLRAWLRVLRRPQERDQPPAVRGTGVADDLIT